jgi:hypothetical protein
LAAWKASKSTDSWPCKASVRQITAYDAGFIIFLEDETVLSCGDPRFRDCLGREVDESWLAFMNNYRKAILIVLLALPTNPESYKI